MTERHLSGIYVGPENEEGDPLCDTCQQNLVPILLSTGKVRVRTNARGDLTITCSTCAPPNVELDNVRVVNLPGGHHGTA